MTLRRAALALVCLTSCGEEGPTYTEIDLHVDVRLAVGAEGTIVHHAERYHPRQEHEVAVWQLGQDELWAVHEFAVFEDALHVWDRRWFVVGAAGALASTIPARRGGGRSIGSTGCRAPPRARAGS